MCKRTAIRRFAGIFAIILMLAVFALSGLSDIKLNAQIYSVNNVENAQEGEAAQLIDGSAINAQSEVTVHSVEAQTRTEDSEETFSDKVHAHLPLILVFVGIILVLAGVVFFKNIKP